ncbi:MAG: ribonuclease E/G [Phycisphaerales bacterium]
MSVKKNRMLINYVPGVECRLAVVREGKLEELHAERADAASHVGNIYVGRVTNVEPGIQAAFVDFGLEDNGFLHITDVHPRYFPGEEEDATERVGLKTPRRERPPIQACLKRGQEVIVQVLKEGVGTKGPTLTSYLSIPGRFLVMMPQMDNVGVSRRVEDEERRRAMRKILDQLDLPEGFGFILRTAGMNQTKAELKRDLAYLQRLWKDMQRRLESGSKPRLLYAESDLLVRGLRDVLASDIEEVVVDDVTALRRAARFLKIVAPRTGPRLLRYADACPLFHRFGVEPQIRSLNEREVKLPSGGALVIDETEAVVAIDVNSGKMRDAKDAETTAVRTNMEAVDEISRQLRLRDLGGVVINDLIDMRSRSHQREVLAKFNDNLKRDRAHTKTLPISQFGIVEMTRQRMRGSHRNVHFAQCPHCHGRGHVRRPAYALADALREVAWLMHFEQVKKIEMVLAPRLAGELLSGGRQQLGRLERLTGKSVAVRVSESAPIDIATFYAYDAKGSDVEIERLKTPTPPSEMEVWSEPTAGAAEDWASDPAEEAATLVRLEAEAEASVAEQMEHGEEFALSEVDLEPTDEEWGTLAESALAGKKKRGRRRGRGGGGAEQGRSEPRGSLAPSTGAKPVEQRESSEEGGGRKRRRRRGGRGRGGEGGGPAQQAGPVQAKTHGGPSRADSWDVEPPAKAAPTAAGGAKSGGGSRGDSWDVDPSEVKRSAGASPLSSSSQNGDAGSGAGEGGKKKRRRRRGGRGRGGEGNGEADSPGPRSAPAPASSGGSGGGAKNTAPSREDSWDVEPAAVKPVVRPVNVPAKASASKGAPSGGSSRGDSWDVEPAGVSSGKGEAEESGSSDSGSSGAKKKTRRRGGRGRSSKKSGS